MSTIGVPFLKRVLRVEVFFAIWRTDWSWTRRDLTRRPARRSSDWVWGSVSERANLPPT